MPSSCLVAGDRHGRARASTAVSALRRFKVPSSWDIVDELPKTSTGKIDKKPLREKLAAAAAERS